MSPFLYEILAYFFIYSFLGWVLETVYASVQQRRFVNRGFLNGPFCPIYGSGAILVILLLDYLPPNIFVLFVGGTILASALEYLTGYIMETAFHTKWWDYSLDRFNLRGRICLKYSLLWGILSVFLLKVIHPAIQSILALYPEKWINVTVQLLAIYFIIDCAFTVWNILKLHQLLNNLQRITEAVKQQKEKLESLLEETQHTLQEKMEEELQALSIRYEQLLEKSRAQLRLIKAFPQLTSKRFSIPLNDIKNKLSKYTLIRNPYKKKHHEE